MLQGVHRNIKKGKQLIYLTDRTNSNLSEEGFYEKYKEKVFNNFDFISNEFVTY